MVAICCVDSLAVPLIQTVILTENTITLTLSSAIIFSSRLSRFTCWWRELWRDGGILQPKGHCLRPHYCLRRFVIPRISHKRTHLCLTLHFISSVCLRRPFSFSQKMELFILLLRSAHLTTDHVAVAHRREERLCLYVSLLTAALMHG